MAITINTTIDFASTSGYTLLNAANITFSSGTAALSAAYVGSGAIRTPTVSVLAFGPIRNAFATITEAIGYRHRFLVSFDDFTLPGTKYFRRHVGREWVPTITSEESENDTIANAVTFGMLAGDLANAGGFAGAQRMTFLVAMQRDSGGGNGSIDTISIAHGTADSSVPYPPAASGTIPQLPEFGGSVDFAQWMEAVRFDENYTQRIERGTALRRTLRVSFPPIGKTAADALVAFLESKRTAPFMFTPLFDAPGAFIVDTKPSIAYFSGQVRQVSATLREVVIP